MKKIFLFITLVSSTIFANSQIRTLDEAMSIAESFLNGKIEKTVSLQPIGNDKCRKLCKSSDSEAPGFYIFNDKENNSFVIISGAESMQPVLAYSDSGTFDADDCSPAVLDILQSYQDAYSVCKNITTSQAPVLKSKEPVQPLIKTKWDQNYPYNDQCPRTSSGYSCVAGCIAIAMAQVMNYYKFPYAGQGELTYRPYEDATETIDFSQCVFDWDNILDVYDENSTQEEIDAVAQLVKAAGYACLTSYSTSASSATLGNDAYSLPHYFNYNPNIRSVMRDYFTDEEWMAMIDEEIDNRRPIIMDASSYYWDYVKKTSGHAFVLDGRDADGYYHFNFGWNGQYDGYYLVDAISPKNYIFNVSQTMVLSISPETIDCQVDDFYSVKFSLEYDENESSLDCLAKNICMSNKAQSPSPDSKYLDIVDRVAADFYFGIFDKDFCLMDTLAQLKNYKYCCGEGLTYEGTIDFDITKYNEGDQFYIAQALKIDGSDEFAFLRPRRYSKTSWYLATVTNGTLELSPEGIIGNPDNLTMDDFVCEVHIPEAGQLNSLIDDKVKGASKLILSGDMNGDDIIALNKILDFGNVNYLDLCNTRIVEGGEAYISLTAGDSWKFFTQNDRLDYYFLYGTEFLKKLRLPCTVESISSSAFLENKRLEKVEIQEGCTWISSIAFNSNPKLKTISIPASLEYLDKKIVRDCPSMESLIISEDSPYYMNVDEVIFTKDMEQLYFFPEWNKRVDYEIPYGVNEIGKDAFQSKQVKSIMNPETLKSIGDGAFRGSIGLESINIPNSVTSIGSSAFEGCTGLECINIPNSVTSIGSSAFEGCTNLKFFVLPNDLRLINYRTFYSCTNLAEVTLPKSISAINKFAFRHCVSLGHITSYIPDMSKVTMGEDVFENIPSDCRWTVGKGCAESYTSCPWWVETWVIEETDLDSVCDPIVDKEPNAVYDLNGVLRATAYPNMPLSAHSLGIPVGIYVINGAKILISD